MLVNKIRTSDRELFAELVNRYEEKLLRYATYLLHDEQKASDVVQDSLIKAYINLNGFDTKKKFSSWIYRIVHNETMNSVKKYHKEVPIIEGMEKMTLPRKKSWKRRTLVYIRCQSCIANRYRYFI